MNVCGCDIGHYLIGGPAYPMQNWLMKPFSDTGRLTHEQQTYNYRLTSAQSVVQMYFGRFKRTMEVPPKKKRPQTGAEQENGTDLLCTP